MTDPAPTTLGTPPAPHRSSLVGREQVRHPAPLSPLRTIALGATGIAGVCAVVTLAGFWHLGADVVSSSCYAIAWIVGAGAAKSSVEHVARGMRGPPVEP